eukprot:SAG25_NODE_9908_length_353_cov_0.610236_1_plen_70_part_10
MSLTPKSLHVAVSTDLPLARSSDKAGEQVHRSACAVATSMVPVLARGTSTAASPGCRPALAFLEVALPGA